MKIFPILTSNILICSTGYFVCDGGARSILSSIFVFCSSFTDAQWESSYFLTLVFASERSGMTQTGLISNSLNVACIIYRHYFIDAANEKVMIRRRGHTGLHLCCTHLAKTT